MIITMRSLIVAFFMSGSFCIMEAFATPKLYPGGQRLATVGRGGHQVYIPPTDKELLFKHLRLEHRIEAAKALVDDTYLGYVTLEELAQQLRELCLESDQVLALPHHLHFPYGEGAWHLQRSHLAEGADKRVLLRLENRAGGGEVTRLGTGVRLRDLGDVDRIAFHLSTSHSSQIVCSFSVREFASTLEYFLPAFLPPFLHLQPLSPSCLYG